MTVLKFKRNDKIGHVDNAKTSLTAAMIELQKLAEENYPKLLGEYRAGRMTKLQLDRHMEEDHGFRLYVREYERAKANAWRV